MLDSALNNVIYLFIYLFVLQRCLLSVCLPFGSFLGRFFASFFFSLSGSLVWFGLAAKAQKLIFINSAHTQRGTH